MRSRRSILLLIICLLLLGLSGCTKRGPESQGNLTKVTFGVSPFQDTLVPIVGREMGWYQQEDLDVQFKILGWTEVQEALASGQVDVAISNIAAVVSIHERAPNIIYLYATNPFDNGFALMIRPNGKLRTLQQIESQVHDHALAVKMTAAQLKGKTVVTTGKTDMEQGVAAAARRGSVDFKKDVKIIDLNHD